MDLSGKYERETADWSCSSFVSITGIGDNEYAGIASFASLRKASGISVAFTGPPSATDQPYFFFRRGFVRLVFAIGTTALLVDCNKNGK
jgi:hypothetical protein